MYDLKQIRSRLEQQKGRKFQLEQTVILLTEEIKEKNRDLQRHEEAKEIIRTVGLTTQQQLQYNISNITSLAMEAVFTDPYELKVEFIQRRNKTECDLLFVRDEQEVNPLDASGLGAVDVASFALRIASWSMSQPHTRNVLLLDEPFKHLRGEEENARVLQMLKTISKTLHVQIIMIGDVKVPKEVIAEYADRVFETRIKGRVTKILQS